jgi:environmental stress-induced protein Ves
LSTAQDPVHPDHDGIVRFAELPVAPWRNGGGVTREVAAAGGFGGQDFDWRISIADVNVPGPFSTFPGVDRIITLVDGERMDLVIDGVEHVLGLHQTLSFDGASHTSCTLPTGPTRDLNVMTRRNRQSAAVALADLSETRPILVAGNEVLVLLSGSAIVTGADGRRAELHLLDALCPTGPDVSRVMGSGLAAVVLIQSSGPAASRFQPGADLQQSQ